MEIGELVSLGWKHTTNAFAEELYLNTGVDATKPVTFFGLVNQRCNVKCRYCEYWRLPEYSEEMSIEQWQNALLSVKDFVGDFSINFSGGEPFIKPGFIGLLAWCRDHGIKAGVTTNGSGLTKANVEKVVAARPFNVNISVDAPYAEVHDYLRGYPGLFEKLSNGIVYLLEERKRRQVEFPITIKPTVNSKNFRHLPALVEWAAKMGDLCVSPQTMDRWSPETYSELWIEEAELPEFEAVIEQLIAMQKNGSPILTPEHILRLMPDHFRDMKAPRSVMPCRVGMRNFFIRTNGDVEVCTAGFPVIGNIKQQSARDIWYSAKAREVRKGTVTCEKLCLITCLSQKTVGNKVGMAMKLLKGSRDSRPATRLVSLK
jgi:MoaA/NifB/PqqE/SkfB family radical SAM enzyme